MNSEKNSRGKKRLNKPVKIVLIVLCVLAVLTGAAFGYVWIKLGLIQQSNGELEGGSSTSSIKEIHEEDNLSEEELEGLKEQEVIHYKKGTVVSDKNVVNILLLGTDERQKKFSDTARSDSMILVSVNFKKDTIKMVSFQRGMGVPILRGEYEGEYDWLTHCFNYGGASLVMDEIEHCYGIKIDHFVRVNFHTFQEAIDAVGGVTVNIDAYVADALNGITDDAAVVKHKVSAGENTLDGYDALQFARVRHCDSDWKRVERQRQVIQALMNKMKKMSFTELNSMLDTILPLIQTDMGRGDMMNYLFQVPSLITGDTEQMTIPQKGTYGSMTGLGGRSMYSVDFDQNAEILIEFLYN